MARRIGALIIRDGDKRLGGTGVSARTGVVQGDGHCGMRVAGTSHHQSELETLAGGRTSESAHQKCTALLLPEPDNPYDPDAVAVYIVANGAKTGIGYLPHDIAPLFNQSLSVEGFSAAGCQAKIVGGWHSEDGDDGYFGVRLDAVLPFQLSPLGFYEFDHAAPIASKPNQIAARRSSTVFKRAQQLAAVIFVAFLAYFTFAWHGDQHERTSAAATVVSNAKAQTIKFECAAPNKVVTHIVEIDNGQARMWARFDPKLTNGPFGPFPATITPEDISWSESKHVGKESSRTTYVIERKTYSLNIEIKNSWDDGPWREKSSCKATAQ